VTANPRRNRAANIAAILVVLLAGALSAAYAFIVPIFQAPDEAAHFDYAISIFSNGGLVRTSGRQAAWIVSPYTRYLLRATDYFRVVFHSSMRAPHGYGTPAFYRRLDANAPSLTDPVAVQGRINYIADLYPFGFYALEAAWMKLIALLSGSLVATFFSARLLCVFLTMLGLYFNYRTALNIGVPPWVSVALVVAVGFFPLTSLVSSYIQPDNLAYALVSASLFFATALRGARHPLGVTGALGICLGLLAITKYQFFLSVAVPVGLLLVASLWHERPRRAAVSARLIAAVLPAVALLTVQLAIAAPTPATPPGSAPSNGFLGPLLAMLRTGIEPTLAYLLTTSLKAFVDFFATGPNSATFWGELGLSGAPLIVINERVEFALRAIVTVVSLLVVAIVTYRLLRNAMRLVTVAARRSVDEAILIATSDPVLGSYALFVILMFLLYVASDNAFGASGRHWYPYVFASFLCTVWYAPRTLRSSRRLGPMIAAIALAAYSIVASIYAAVEVTQRYYGKTEPSYSEALPSPTQIESGRALGVLWPVQGMDLHVFGGTSRHTFAVGSRLWAGGDAVFTHWHTAAHVAVAIDGRFAVRTLYGLYNFKLAEATHDLTYGYSGFFAPFSTSGLSEGAHVVRAYAEIPGSDLYQQILPPRVFFLATGNRFSEPFLRRLDSAPALPGDLNPVKKCPQSLLFVSGSQRRSASANSVAWLLVDVTPYPAQYSDDRRSFWGTIPAAALKPGLHSVSAFVTDPAAPRSWRILGSRGFITTARPEPLSLHWSAPHFPAECGADDAQ